MMMKRVLLLTMILCLSVFGICQNNFHIIQSGDNIGMIANRYGKQSMDLLQWNDLDRNSTLRIGDTIWLISPRQRLEEKLANEEAKKTETQATIQLAESSDEGNMASGNTGRNKSRNNGREKNAKTTNNVGSHSCLWWVYLLIGLLVGGTLGVLFGKLVLLKKAEKAFSFERNDFINRISRLEDNKRVMNKDVEKLRSQLRKVENEKRGLLEENVSLGEEMDRLKGMRRIENVDETESSKDSLGVSRTSAQSKFLYSDAIIEDYFVKVRETPNDDAIFILALQGENTAVFSIYKASYQRVIANPSFLEGCEKQILGNSMELEIVSKGTAQKDTSNGKWKIINKLNVIIR